MTETVGLLLLIGSCYLIGQSVYHYGKATGSRKGFHVGRMIGFRNRRGKR